MCFKLLSHFGRGDEETFKYPYSQLLVLYRLLKIQYSTFFPFFVVDVSHTRNIRNRHLPQSAPVIYVKKTTMPKSAGERLYGLAPSMADNRTQGSDAGCLGAPMGPRSAGAAAALRLSSSGCLHLSPSLRRLPPPQAI